MTDPANIDRLQQQLAASGFEGDFESGYAERVVAATDNSVYQVLPSAILYPRSEQDIQRAMACVHRLRNLGFSLTARGAGTGTNGQSLSDNLVLDCGRHLNRIIDFDAERQTVSVQPGVVLEQLNEFLKPHGLFFPIDISTSSRATLGGMVGTDASGKGSLIYGKTSDHIESLAVVLADGSEHEISALSMDELASERPLVEELLNPLYLQIESQRDEIERVFPDMNRGLSGYDLKHAIAEHGIFNPCYLFTGAEGTLGIVQQIRLRVSKRPTHRLLSVVFYEDFMASLEHVQQLLKAAPAAIEMLDDKILNLARQDSVWFDVQSVLELPADKTVRAANFIEFVGFSEQEIQQQAERVDEILQQHSERYSVILAKTETRPDKISALWNLRKRAVGLLGKLQDDKRGIAFVEDSAVPSANLAQYVRGFRDLLEQHQVDYGMYGHADAGVLHVRPALNMMQANDRRLLRVLSDAVADLAKQNGGVLWGEHGRGYRGEYAPLFFGQHLLPLLREIKYYFDPYNLLNPGKLMTPGEDLPITPLDQVPLRGEIDEQISPADQANYADTLYCNGNGACFNVSAAEAMCPSYKATRNKLYSPKGRSAMLREWIRIKDHPSAQKTQLEQQLLDSLNHCLSCKSCTASCPLKVDIPELKSRFFAHWHRRHARPLRDIFSRYFETLIAVGHLFPRTANRLLHGGLTGWALQRITGLNRLPLFSTANLQGFDMLRAGTASSAKLSGDDIILLRDNYLNSFDQHTLLAAGRVLKRLGYRVWISEVIHNGKLLHVKGMRKVFRRQAATVLQQLAQYAASGATLVSLETMTRLMPQKEYADITGETSDVRIDSIENVMLKKLPASPPQVLDEKMAVTLLPHCLEQTTARDSMQTWQSIFQSLGLQLNIKQAGCCGMSGVFGHEIDNNALSDQVFELYWKPLLEKGDGEILATGFSCRCQLKNHHFSARHPVQFLDQHAHWPSP